MIPHNTIVQTDQGPVLVQKLTTNHSINLWPIIFIVQGKADETYLIRIEASALGYQYPDRPTILSKTHQVYYNRRMIPVHHLVNNTTIRRIPYHGEIMYHILLDYHSNMRVNQLVIETLDPKNYFS